MLKMQMVCGHENTPFCLFSINDFGCDRRFYMVGVGDKCYIAFSKEQDKGKNKNRKALR